MKNILVAIDQGNSKTDIAIASYNGNILTTYHHEYEQINFNEHRWEIINNIVLDALHSIGYSIDNIGHLLAAVCGADDNNDIIRMHRILSDTLNLSQDKVSIVNDSWAALRAGMSFKYKHENYAVIYAGTMFNCTLLYQNGYLYTYGKRINGCDNASYAIGRAAWEAVVDSYNGFHESTIMEPLFLKFYNKETIFDLITDFSSQKIFFSPIQYSSILFVAAQENDIIANQIINKLAYRWSMYIINGLSKVHINKEAEIKIILTGGIFKNCSNLWLKSIELELTKYLKNASCILSSFEPVVGATLLLLEKINGAPLDDNIIHNLKRTYVNPNI